MVADKSTVFGAEHHKLEHGNVKIPINGLSVEKHWLKTKRNRKVAMVMMEDIIGQIFFTIVACKYELILE